MYPHFDDDYPRHDDYNRYNNYDDFYSGRYNDLHQDYFDDKHYIRLPPHILCTPVVAELPKMYSNNKAETEKLLFLAVSYYFDEDEYEGFFSYKRFVNSDYGDETETQRGMYTANAIMVFHFGDSPRWGEYCDKILWNMEPILFVIKVDFLGYFIFSFALTNNPSTKFSLPKVGKSILTLVRIIRPL